MLKITIEMDGKKVKPALKSAGKQVAKGAGVVASRAARAADKGAQVIGGGIISVILGFAAAAVFMLFMIPLIMAHHERQDDERMFRKRCETVELSVRERRQCRAAPTAFWEAR